MKIFVKNKSFRGGKKKSELDPEGVKYLKKLASKFGTAIEKRAGGVKISQIGDEEEKKYSYETLTKKNDLVVVSFTDNVPKKDNGQINSKAVLAEGRKNARAQANTRNTDTETYVRVDDIKIDVLIGAKGMQHGLARSEETAMAVMKIGDILKNSVAINELNGSTERQTEMSHVLLGACKDSENVYAVRTTVSKLNNNVTDIDIFQLGAVKGKKIETPNSALKRGGAVTELSSLISSESPTISIADFLEYVKDISLINEAFSQDVADNLGVTRSKGALTNDLRYSRKRTYDPKNDKEPTFDAASEGAEEVVSDVAIDPGLKFVTGVDKNIGENYKQAIKDAPEIFGTGVAVGSIMQGGTSVIRSGVNAIKGRGGAKATRADNAIQNISEITKLYDGTSSKNFQYDNAVKFNLGTVSDELKRMSPEARKKYLGSIGVYKNAFDLETGALKENTMLDTHREAITANLRTFSGNLAHKPLRGGENITEGAKTAKKTVERVVGSGAAVVVTNELGAEDRAIYNPDDGVIYINNNADLTEKDVANMVALHEIAHATEGTKAYARLIETLENMMDDPNAPQAIKDIVGNVEARRSGIKKDYAEQLGKMSDQYQKGYLVQSELHADLVGELLGNDYFIEKLAERDMGLLQKIYNSFKNRSLKKNSELGPEGIKYLKKLASKFGTAIEKRAGGVKLSQIGDEEEKEEKSQEADGASTNPTKENVSNVRYSKKSFSQQVDDILKGQDTMSTHLLVMKTPKLLQDAGLPNLPILMTAGHLKSIVAPKNKANSHDHGLDLTIVKKLPEYISDPVVVADSNSRSDSIVVITEAVDFNNNPVIAAIKLEGHGAVDSKYIDANIMTSAYGKDNFQNFINKLAKNNAIIYWNNKKSQAMSVNLGVQFPNIMTQLDSNTIIRKAGAFVNRKISDVTESQQFKRFFGDWQNKPQSASKIVNDDGTPRIVYHQTDADITTFDTSVEGAGARDNALPHGIYMKPTPFDIGLKGKKQMKLYASIKTPLVFDTRETAQRYWKKNIPGYDAILDEIAENDAKYNDEFENAFDATSEDDSTAEEILAEWEEKNTVLDKKAKSLIDTYLENSRFDGIILEKDVGSMGRTVTTYIALKPEQVKSATDNIGTFDRDNPDIRYSRRRTYDPKNGKNDVLEIAEAVRRENEAEMLREFEERYNADVKRTAEILDEIAIEAGKRELPVADRECGQDNAAEQKTAEAERNENFEEQLHGYVNELMELNKRQKEAAEGFINATTVSSAPVTYEFEDTGSQEDRERQAEAQRKASQDDIQSRELEKYKAQVKNRQAEFESIVSGVREAIEVTYEFENSHSNAEMLSEVQKEALERLKQLSQEGAETLKSQAEEHNDSVQALLDSITLEEAKRLGIKETDPKMLYNMGELAKMESILTVDPIKLEKTGKKPKDMFNEYFQSLGGVIHSERFGDISLTNSSASSEIRHGITAEKLATIEVIPDVIQKGQVIFNREKEAGVHRIVVCAPIKIGTRNYYMGVMLQKAANSQRLYLHNVVSMEIKRKATASPKADRVTNGAPEGSSSSKVDLVTTGTPENNDLSMTIILQNALKVKLAKEKYGL